MVGEHHSKDRTDTFKFGNFFSFWNIEMLFYSSSPHPIISFYIEPPYPLKIYSTINKWMARIEESLVNYCTDWVHKWNKSKKCCSMRNVLSWLTAIKSHALGVRLTQTNLFKPLFLTPSRFCIYFVDFEIGNCCFH